MAKYKSILHRVDIEVAKRRRACKHDPKHTIRQNETSLVIRESQYDRRVYCRDCALGMIELTRKSLAEIEGLLTSSGSQA